MPNTTAPATTENRSNNDTFGPWEADRRDPAHSGMPTVCAYSPGDTYVCLAVDTLEQVVVMQYVDQDGDVVAMGHAPVGGLAPLPGHRVAAAAMQAWGQMWAGATRADRSAMQAMGLDPASPAVATSLVQAVYQLCGSQGLE